MPYTPTMWVDENPTGEPKYALVDDELGEIATSASLYLVSPVVPGTQVNAANLNHLETGVQIAEATAEAAQAAANTKIPKSLATSIGQILYSTAAGVWAVLNSPTTTGLLQVNSAGAVSHRSVKATVHLQVALDGLQITLSDEAYFFIPSTMNGMNLIRAKAFVTTVGSSGNTIIQIKNNTRYSSFNILSTALTIPANQLYSNDGVVNAAYDDVQTNDSLKVFVSSLASSPPQGLYVVLEYQLP